MCIRVGHVRPARPGDPQMADYLAGLPDGQEGLHAGPPATALPLPTNADAPKLRRPIPPSTGNMMPPATTLPLPNGAKPAPMLTQPDQRMADYLAGLPDGMEHVQAGPPKAAPAPAVKAPSTAPDPRMTTYLGGLPDGMEGVFAGPPATTLPLPNPTQATKG